MYPESGVIVSTGGVSLSLPSVYCQMLDDYRLDDECYRIIRALYDQRKSSLL